MSARWVCTAGAADVALFLLSVSVVLAGAPAASSAGHAVNPPGTCPALLDSAVPCAALGCAAVLVSTARPCHCRHTPLACTAPHCAVPHCTAPHCAVLQVYVLNILTRSALAAATAALAEDGLPYGGGVPPLSPTWEAVLDYLQYAYAEAGLALSDAALGILQNTTFAALSGCPAQCTYVAAAFPSANQTSPIIAVSPSKNSSCPMSTPAKQRTEATALSQTSDMCAADWQEAYVSLPGFRLPPLALLVAFPPALSARLLLPPPPPACTAPLCCPREPPVPSSCLSPA